MKSKALESYMELETLVGSWNNGKKMAKGDTGLLYVLLTCESDTPLKDITVSISSNFQDKEQLRLMLFDALESIRLGK